MIYFDIKKISFGGITAKEKGGLHAQLPVKGIKTKAKAMWVLKVVMLSGLAIFGYCTRAEAQESTCSVGFVFSGQVNQALDSVFFLQYTFPSAEVRNLKQFILEDARGQYRLIANKPGMQGDMEIKNEQDKVRVIVHRYDKLDLPVLVKGEDLSGQRHELYIRTGGGVRISGEQFRVRMLKNLAPAPVSEPVPAAEPDPSIKNPNPSNP